MFIALLCGLKKNIYCILIHEFCSNILFVMISTLPRQELDNLQFVLPKGIWLSFDFDDSHPVCSTVIFVC